MKHLISILILLGFMSVANSAFANECVSGDCANGYSTNVWDNGDKYVGEYKNGLMHGKGEFEFSSGSKYVGEFRNNTRDGHGTYIYSNGHKYVGLWENGRKHGKGEYRNKIFTLSGCFVNDVHKGYKVEC